MPFVDPCHCDGTNAKKWRRWKYNPAHKHSGSLVSINEPALDGERFAGSSQDVRDTFSRIA